MTEPARRSLSVAESRAIDRDAVERLQMPTLLLMENAARSVGEVARTLGSEFVILCGPGNNGGDGLAAARHLGRAARVHLLREPDPQQSSDAALQLRILRAAGLPVVVGALPAPGDVPDDAVWIDALFGTGLERPVAGVAASWIDAFNQAHGPKLSVDIPSGLHGDRGEVLGTACRADVTVTFVLPKAGMLVGEGPACCGRIVVVGLGLP